MALRCSSWRPSRWCKARSPRLSTPTATFTSPRCATIRTSRSRAASRWARCGCCATATATAALNQSHVFADGLLWAAGIAPWKGGVFVTAPPDIWYLKDTDGDGKADVRQKVFTGFGTQNQQAMVNNLTWGLDHMDLRRRGGQRRDDPAGCGLAEQRRLGRAQRLSIRPGHDALRADQRVGPVRQHVRRLGQPVHSAMSLIRCRTRSCLCLQLARNPFLAVPSVVQDIAGGSVPIFRISPIERWRQIRSSRRIAHGTRSAESAGASHHVVDAGAGVTIYRGSAYPAEFYGNAFVGDAQNNLVHRRILVPDGPTFKAIRGPREAGHRVRALVGQLVSAREFRQRARWHALRAGYEPRGHRGDPHSARRGQALEPQARARPGPYLPDRPSGVPLHATASIEPGDDGRARRRALARKDGWYRDTAHRLIYERQDPAAIEPAASDA